MTRTPSHPLAPPERDSAAAVRFLRHFGLLRAELSGRDALRAIAATSGCAAFGGANNDHEDPRLAALTAVAQAFSTLPYENLTRIIHYDQHRLTPFRGPEIVVGDHIQFRSGGTCFALTSALLHVVRWLGFEAAPLLADRRYGANTHSALRVMIDGRPHLLDPGYLINRPVPLDSLAARTAEIPTGFNRLLLQTSGDERVDLRTRNTGQSGETYRLTFKTRPADDGEFLDAWRASFDSEILHKPLLTKVAAGRQWFLNARRLQIRDNQQSVKQHLNDDELFAQIVNGFGLDAGIARQALEILQRQGDLEADHKPAIAGSAGDG